MSLKKRLSKGEFVVLAEMNPPKGVDITRLLSSARLIKGRVDGVVIPDMDVGVMRMSALGGGVLMNQLGMEAVIHVYGRDRNSMAIQGDILAAHVLGIQNLIVTTGEDMANGDHPSAKVVDELDVVGLLSAVQSLEDGADLSGIALEGSPSLLTGCAIEAYKDDASLEKELELAAKKVEAGAEFIITPPVYDLKSFDSFYAKASALKVPIIPTVFLIKSVGVARYIARNEPWAGVSDDLIKRIRQAADRENECLKIAGELAAGLREKAQGVKIVTIGWETKLPVILDYAGM